MFYLAKRFELINLEETRVQYLSKMLPLYLDHCFGAELMLGDIRNGQEHCERERSLYLRSS